MPKNIAIKIDEIIKILNELKVSYEEEEYGLKVTKQRDEYKIKLDDAKKKLREVEELEQLQNVSPNITIREFFKEIEIIEVGKPVQKVQEVKLCNICGLESESNIAKRTLYGDIFAVDNHFRQSGKVVFLCKECDKLGEHEKRVIKSLKEELEAKNQALEKKDKRIRELEQQQVSQQEKEHQNQKSLFDAIIEATTVKSSTPPPYLKK